MIDNNSLSSISLSENNDNENKNDDYVTELEEQKEIILEAYDTEMDQIRTDIKGISQQLKTMNRRLDHLAKEKEKKEKEFEQLLNEHRRLEETKKVRVDKMTIKFYTFFFIRSNHSKQKTIKRMQHKTTGGGSRGIRRK